MTRHTVTGLLLKWRGGDQAALDDLVPLVEDQLRRIARQYMRKERAGHTLQTTALVNEAYLKLIGDNRVDWQDRAHFFNVMARLMRRVLVEYARAHGARKRGYGERPISLDETLMPAEGGTIGLDDLIAIDEALNRLEKEDERSVNVVVMRFFGGMTEKEIAEALGVTDRTVKSDWRYASTWLRRELSRHERTNHDARG